MAVEVQPLEILIIDTLLQGTLESLKILKVLFTIGPSYREPQSINFSKVFSETNKANNSYVENMATKNKTDIELFQNWKEISVSKI